MRRERFACFSDPKTAEINTVAENVILDLNSDLGGLVSNLVRISPIISS
jgi:hypothetical protein